MSWIFGPQAWQVSGHAYNRRRGSFPCIGVLFWNDSKKRCIQMSIIYLSWQCLCSSVAATHHIWVIPVLVAVPLSSTRVSDHPELANDPLLNTRTNISMLRSDTVRTALFLICWWFPQNWRSWFQFPAFCDCLRGTQHLSHHVTTEDTVTVACSLASYQRVISSTWRCGFSSYLKSSLQDTFIQTLTLFLSPCVSNRPLQIFAINPPRD